MAYTQSRWWGRTLERYIKDSYEPVYKPLHRFSLALSGRATCSETTRTRDVIGSALDDLPVRALTDGRSSLNPMPSYAERWINGIRTPFDRLSNV
jgi:hypothetical protein